MTIHLLCPLIGSDDRTGRGGPSPWEQDTAGHDMWPGPDGGGEEADAPVTPDIGEESVLCGTDIGRQTNGQVRAEVKEGPVENNTFRSGNGGKPGCGRGPGFGGGSCTDSFSYS